MRAFFRHDQNLLIAKPVIARSCHCERSEAIPPSLRAKRSNPPVIASAAKQSLFRYMPQARPRLHACTTSATADLRPAPYEVKSNLSAGSLQGVEWLRAA